MSPLVLTLAVLGVPLLVGLTWVLGFGRMVPLTAAMMEAELTARGLQADAPPVIDLKGRGGVALVSGQRVLLGRSLADRPMWRLVSLAEVVFRRCEDGRIEVSIPGDLGFSPTRWSLAEVPPWMS
jgi:hypothetical protein